MIKLFKSSLVLLLICIVLLNVAKYKGYEKVSQTVCEAVIKKTETQTRGGKPLFYLHTNTQDVEVSAYQYVGKKEGDLFCYSVPKKNVINSFWASVYEKTAVGTFLLAAAIITSLIIYSTQDEKN